MFQNLVKIFGIGELLPQKRIPIDPDSRKLRNTPDHGYRSIIKFLIVFLGHVLSTLIRHTVLNAHGICSFTCLMDDMRLSAFTMGHVFFASAMGFRKCCLRSSPQISQDRFEHFSLAHFRAFSRTFTYFHAFSRTQISITRFALMRNGLNAIAKEINDALWNSLAARCPTRYGTR